MKNVLLLAWLHRPHQGTLPIHRLRQDSCWANGKTHAESANGTPKGCVLFSPPRCLQMTSLLRFLLLVLSLQALLAVMKHSKLEKIELGATIHAPFNELEPIHVPHVPFDRTITPRQC